MIAYLTAGIMSIGGNAHACVWVLEAGMDTCVDI